MPENKDYILSCLHDAIRAWTVNHLAKDLGMDINELLDFFAEDSNPTKTFIARFAKAFATPALQTVG